MKEEILDIAKKLYHNHLTPEIATNLLFDLSAVSKRHLLESILEDMDGKHPKYHREVVEGYLDDGC